MAVQLCLPPAIAAAAQELPKSPATTPVFSAFVLVELKVAGLHVVFVGVRFQSAYSP
jgi:hypothetical protein